MSAASLVCGDCGLQLKSASAAQSHAEATGHINFAESTEKPLRIVCTTCGKPCVSQTEKDVHTKRTGHTDFVDKTNEDTSAVKYDWGVGGPAPAPTPAPAPAQGAAPMSDGDAGPPGELVPPPVDPAIRAQLLEMGFTDVRADRAIWLSGNTGLEQALAWLDAHQEDADIDTPLLIPSSETARAENPAPVLSPEEAKKKAQELQKRLHERRIQKDKEAEIEAERNRIRIGKERAAAQRASEETQLLLLKRQKEERQREKLEEQKYKEKLKQQMEQDRLERRARAGLPINTPAPVPAPAPAPAAAPTAAPVAPAAGAGVPAARKTTPKLCILDILAMNREGRDAAVCLETISKYCANILENPAEPKFRSIRKSNAAFQTRVASRPGGLALLQTLGFQDDGEFLQLPIGSENQTLLRQIIDELHNAATNPFYK